jgi:alpha-ketoglutarate-dependent taurine dioxygenase
LRDHKFISNSGSVIAIENGEILCVSPLRDDLSFEANILQDKELLLDILRKRGAILFRGYQVQNASDFNLFCTVLTPQVVDYSGGTSPRIKVSPNVYTSTEYPSSSPIAMHNEMSYKSNFPDFIYFYCATAPSIGGETPIADSRKILECLPAHLVNEFESRNVSYIRNMIDSPASFGSWQRVFETENRDLIKELCEAQGISYHWDEFGTLHTEEVHPGIRVHARTGERVWFNQAHMWHISNASQDIDLTDIDENDLPMNAAFGDRGKIDLESLTCIRDAFKRFSMHFKWQQRDVLLLDNMLMAHGRMPFTGDRKILVAMGLDQY